MSKRWYIIHAYSNFEKKVAESIQERASLAGIEDLIEEVIVPTEDVVEIRRGRKVNTEKRFFPGYVLVEMEMNEQTWHLVKNTDKVTGFVGGSSSKPSPISEREVDKIMAQMKEGVEKPKPKVLSPMVS